MGAKRKQFVAGAFASAYAGVVMLRAPSQAAEFQWKLAHDQAASHPVGVGSNELAAAVKRESNGRFEIQVFPLSTLGNNNSLISQVRTGAIQINLQAAAPLSAIVPVAAIERVGFAFPSRKAALAAMDGALGAYIVKEFAAAGLVVPLKIWEGGYRQISTNTKPIRTVEDLNGLRIRTPVGAITTDFFKQLGASPVPIDGNEIYVALQTHIVDAMEGPFVNFLSLRTYEVQKFVSVTNHQWNGFWVCINPAAYNALPPDLRAIVHRNAIAAGTRECRFADLQNAAVADQLVRLGLKENVADVSGFRARLGSYYAHWKSEFGPTVWGLLEQYTSKLG